MNDSMQKKQLAEMARNLAAELSATQMREMAAELMALATQADGLRLHTVMHAHNFGESTYHCLAKPGLEDEVAGDDDARVAFAVAIGIHLEPHRGESIYITPVKPSELSSPPIYTCGEQDVESVSSPRPQG